MNRGLQGQYIPISSTGEKAEAFIPKALPPSPPIEWSSELRIKFDEALLALGRLDSVSKLLPDVSLFLYMYIRKEAVLSSMIEGTRSSISDLLLFEAAQQPGVPMDDVREVSNYVRALEHGLNRVKSGLPLSLRLIKEVHAILLAEGRGSDKNTGEFRRSQNWIGGTRPGNSVFVPPPPENILQCMDALELFINDRPEPTPVLLKAALFHVQFETIHPFRDGNGRLGRLMIALILCERDVLQEPMLYLSIFFKTHRQLYYDLLNRVRFEGDWEAWLDFFAEAVIVTAGQAVGTVQRLETLAKTDKNKIKSLGRAAGSALRLHYEFLKRPLTTSRSLESTTGLSHVTVNKTLDHLCNISIISELTGFKRNRVFCYPAYIDILNEGTELPAESK